MFIFEIVTPGIQLDHEDRDWSFKIFGQLIHLKSQFFQANLALNLLIGSRSVAPERRNKEEEWFSDRDRHLAIRETLLQEDREFWMTQNEDDIRFEADVRLKQEKWRNGKIPREFENKLPLMHARAFLYALDGFDKFLGVLAKEKGVPEQVAQFHTQFGEAFPHLRGVRNTAQHLEDRARGLGAGFRGRPPEPLDLKPLSNWIVDAPAGNALILGGLNGSRYGSTMADGHYGEIDVSAESMQRLQKILEGVLQSFKWTGPKHHEPSA